MNFHAKSSGFSKNQLRAATGAVLAAAAVFTSAAFAPAATAAPAAKDRTITKTTPTGVKVKVGLHKPKLDAYPALDSNPFSREAFLSMTGEIALSGDSAQIAKTKTQVDIGYQIGSPVTIAKDGAKIGLVTPNLTLNSSISPEIGGGATAGVTPSAGLEGTAGAPPSVGGKLGIEAPLGVNGTAKVGSTAGAEAEVIPSQTIDFTLGHGEIKEVSVTKFDLKEKDAYLDIGGIQMSVGATAGRVSVRPYVRAIIETPRGRTISVIYGEVQYM